MALYQAIAHQTVLQKSEFETLDQYHDRVALRADSRLLGNLKLNDAVAFVISCDAWEPNKTCSRYDAETGTLNVLLPFDSAASGSLADIEKSSPIPRSIQVREERGPRSSAGMGQNGFGARFPISKQSITRYYVGTTVPDWFNRTTVKLSGEQDPVVQISMDPATAMQAKDSVRELMVGHLSAPFLGDVEDSVVEATTSYRVRADVHIRTVHMDIDEVWFWNQKTGQIYRKVRPSPS